MENVVVSRHARQRIKERCGVSKKSADRVSRLAVERGTEREQTKGMLRKWLDHKYTEGQKMFAYGDKAFFFSCDGVLITVIQIPSTITKNMSRMIVQPA